MFKDASYTTAKLNWPYKGAQVEDVKGITLGQLLALMRVNHGN